MSSDARRLAAEIADLRRTVRDLSTVAGLGSSSIEDDYTPVYDADGTIRQIIGAQADGTFTNIDLNGPAPQAPAAPTVSGRPGLLVVASYGLSADGSGWPLDFLRLDVHVGATSGFTPTAATKVGEFTADGGSLAVALDEGTYYAVLVAVNTSGNTSAPSVEVSADVTAPATGSGGVKTYHADTGPVGLTATDDGAIWYETDAGNLPHRWDGLTLAWVAMPLGTGGLADAAVDGSKIAVDSIEVRHLKVVGVNGVANAGFESGLEPHFWNIIDGFDISITPAIHHSGTQAFRCNFPAVPPVDAVVVIANGYVSDTTAHPRVQPGETWRFGYFVRSEAATAALDLKAGAQICDATGAILIEQNSPVVSVVDDQWVEISVDITVPVDQYDAAYVDGFVRVSSAAAGDTAIIDDLSLIRKSGADLIVDGAIDGQTITGAFFRTHETGARIEINNPDLTASAGMIAFYNDDVGWDPGIVYSDFSASTGINMGRLLLQGPNVVGSGAAPAQIQLATSDTGIRQITLNAEDITCVGEINVNTGMRVGGPAQRLLRGIDYGNKNATTDSQGRVTITHQLGQVPVAILIFPSAGTSQYNYGEVASHRSATSFEVDVENTNGTAAANLGINFDWVAFY